MVIQAFSDTQRVFEQIEATEKSVEKRIAAYIDIFAQSHKASLLPLCCALSAETANLPQAIALYRHHFISICKSSGSQSRQGRAWESGEFSSHAEPSDIALMIINVCEGSKRSGACNGQTRSLRQQPCKYIKLFLNTLIQENDTMLDWNNYRSELMQRLGELGKLTPRP